MTIIKLPLAKEIDGLSFEKTPVNETLVRDLAAGESLEQQRNVVLIEDQEVEAAEQVCRAPVWRAAASRSRLFPHSLFIGEAAPYPLTGTYHQNGPRRVYQALRRVIENFMERGLLQRADDQVADLCLAAFPQVSA